MKYRKLGNTGLDVSILSFGASSLGGVFRDVDPNEGIRTVHEAFNHGINLMDVSPYYGLTKAETVLGMGLKELPRDRIILSTKAGRYGIDLFDFSPARLVSSVEESMQRLGTDYIDILYLHDVEFANMNEIIEESIPALNRLKEQGKIRFTGISGLPLAVFRKVLNAVRVDCVLSYCHYSLNDDSLIGLLPLFREKGVGLVNASPLSMGLLGGRPAPDWHPASSKIKDVCRQAAEYCKDNGLNLAKLAIQFAVSHEEIPTTLVSTANSLTIVRNAEMALEPIDSEILKRILPLFESIHNETWASGRPENQGTGGL